LKAVKHHKNTVKGYWWQANLLIGVASCQNIGGYLVNRRTKCLLYGAIGLFVRC
jgi:hypothetical protein